MKALERNPDKRYQSMTEFNKELDKLTNSASATDQFKDIWRGYKENEELEFFAKHIIGHLEGIPYEETEKEFRRYRRRKRIVSRVSFAAVPLLVILFSAVASKFTQRPKKLVKIKEDYDKTWSLELKANEAFMKSYMTMDHYERIIELHKSFRLYAEAEDADKRYVNYLNKLKLIKIGMDFSYEEMKKAGSNSKKQHENAKHLIEEVNNLLKRYMWQLNIEMHRDSEREFEHLVGY